MFFKKTFYAVFTKLFMLYTVIICNKIENQCH